MWPLPWYLFTFETNTLHSNSLLRSLASVTASLKLRLLAQETQSINLSYNNHHHDIVLKKQNNNHANIQRVHTTHCYPRSLLFVGLLYPIFSEVTEIILITNSSSEDQSHISDNPKDQLAGLCIPFPSHVPSQTP